MNIIDNISWTKLSSQENLRILNTDVRSAGSGHKERPKFQVISSVITFVTYIVTERD